MTLWVADISANNSVANWRQAIKDNDAIIIKISEGLTYVSPVANAQYQDVKKSGKRIGFYHFVVGGIDPVKQAEFFYNNAKNYLNEKGAVVAFDFEQPNGYPNLTGNEPRAFLDRLAQLTGKDGQLYIGHKDVISSKFDWSDIKGKYPLWVAGYPKNDGSAYSQALQEWADQNYFSNPAYNGQVISMWQYDSVPYDRSIAFMDGTAWDKYGTKKNEQGSNNSANAVKQDRQFKNDEKVKMKSYAYASAYGTRFTDDVKRAYGRVAWITNENHSFSNQIVKVGFFYNDRINYWNVLAQDLEYVKE